MTRDHPLTFLNVMTLPYGGTAYGLGNQIVDDCKKHGIPLLLTMENSWGIAMGRYVYDDCRVSLKRPMQLLEKFEAAGKRAEEIGVFLRWTTPIVNFPVCQHYTEGTVHPLYIQYGPPEGERDSRGYFANTYKLHILFTEEMQPSKRKQAQGAAPNIVHSLDATHLIMTACACDFTVTTVHDSFGCLLADMPELYVTVREQLVRLYKEDPLRQIMEQIGGSLDDVEFGTLDIESVLDSEFCFA